MTVHAGEPYDAGEPCGVEANAAELLAAEARRTARTTLGGFGHAEEDHVERPVRAALRFRIVPVTPNTLAWFVAEQALGLPRSP